ncbi:hypothetical protein HF324_06210 [Chitinophaga oryzae]|uniref:Uncharacterized protein n=1 Tax=Chitinophaga oryzae TaxID=2725414 RepID=A0AAE6ZFM2_9BACT|nr:hypothetical protein [Chitinophaga oryzae]QJB30982.1 hypothetical protein HF329_06565 [Chitinophaga oryzae]QJB37467.1 hypothetical protein HF324_06210 [Chitinophaga oryzae]
MRTISRQTSYLILTASGAVILAFLRFSYHRFNPFHLAGKQFLGFYSLLLLFTLGNVLLLRRQYPRMAGAVNGFCLLLGIARLIQGMYHHKPVGYLMLLLMFPVIIAFSLKSASDTAA